MSNPDTVTAPRLRVAIVSTPRTGNTWLRHLLYRVWSLQAVAVHHMTEEQWAQLPPDCVLQIHHYPDDAFVQRLEAEGFQVITLARHPLDVLISILHVSVYGVESEHWLGGLHGDESCLWGAMPGSQAFLDYATGPRAAALFEVTNRWWNRPRVISIRYEDFNGDPGTMLHGFETLLGLPRGQSIEQALAETAIPKLKVSTGSGHHFWQGRSGLWREFLPAEVAQQIAASLASTFDKCGYVCDPDPALDRAQADRNWINCSGRELRATLDRSTEMHRAHLQAMHDRLVESAAAMKEWEARYAREIAAREQVEAARDKVINDLSALQPFLAFARPRMEMLEGCERFSLRCACFVQGVINRLPWLLKTGRWLLRLFAKPEPSPVNTMAASTIPSGVEQSHDAQNTLHSDRRFPTYTGVRQRRTEAEHAEPEGDRRGVDSPLRR